MDFNEELFAGHGGTPHHAHRQHPQRSGQRDNSCGQVLGLLLEGDFH